MWVHGVVFPVQGTQDYTQSLSHSVLTTKFLQFGTTAHWSGPTEKGLPAKANQEEAQTQVGKEAETLSKILRVVGGGEHL